MTDPIKEQPIGAVVIGRNEGARLIDCLRSISHLAPRLIYVDSGSVDGSLEAAQELGAVVVLLDMTRPFTAARARNAGWRHLLKLHPDTQFVQFVDGDCEVVAGWLESASAFLIGNKAYAVACGRRRERHPELSVYNRLCDLEWNTPVGDAKACGGDAMVRTEALLATNGYRDDLIAGEEPEWCVRLRKSGWKIRRMDHDMTWHDAAIHRFGQWWQRSKRGGFAFAAGSYLHGAAPDFHWAAETRRAIFWGATVPLFSILASLAWAPTILTWPALYCLQFLRLRIHNHSWEHALFLVLSKLPEARGVLQFHYERVIGRQSHIIEYK